MPKTNESCANTSQSKPSESSDAFVVTTLTPDEAAKLATEDPLADKVWRLAASGKSMREIGKLFGKSHTWAWSIVVERTKELQDISSVEHKAANRGIVLSRLDWAADKCEEFIDGYDADSANPPPLGALLAVYVKCAIERAKITGVSGEMDVATVVNADRLAEVTRRIMLAGPHSKARELLVRRVMDMADVKDADVREITSPPAT